MKAMVVIGFIFCVAILLAALTSCVSLNKTMYSADGEKWYQCKSNGYGIIGSTTARQQQANCEAEARRQGYN